MTGWGALFLVMFTAANPAAGARANPARAARTTLPAAVLAMAIAVGIAAIAAWTAESLLDWLDIEQETARIAAGIVLGVGGGQAVVLGGPLVRNDIKGLQRGIYPLGVPLSMTPGLLAVLIAFAAHPDASPGRAFFTAIPWIIGTGAVAVFLPARAAPIADGISRLTGAAAIVLAVALIVSGVRDV